MAGYTSYADFFERGPQRGFVVEKYLQGTARISFTRLSGNPPGSHQSPKVPEMLLIVCGTGSYQMRYNLGLGWRSGRFRRGDLLLAPPNFQSEYRTHTDTAFDSLALPVDFVDACLEDCGGVDSTDFGILHDRQFRDGAIKKHVASLMTSASASAADPLHVDERLISLIGCLISKASRADARRQRRVGLSADTVKRIEDYVEANLERELNLAQLASLAGLSLAHFARAFRLTVGKPPHRYVLDRRIEHAKSLLRGTTQPIAAIAFDCGFSSQAHLTSVFSRHVGVTPAKFRKSI